MDKIWDRKSFDVGGHCRCGGGGGVENPNDYTEPTKVERLKNKIIKNKNVHATKPNDQPIM